MRPPGGHYDPKTKLATKDSGLSIILWSVDSCDWKSGDTEQILSLCRSKIENGSIVLFHDKLRATYHAIEQLVPWLLDNGYDLVTVSELLESRGELLEPGKIYTKKVFD
jgi:peptidoglycan/xylan/chitin deacetylase (PgdA/CDA1 family)